MMSERLHRMYELTRTHFYRKYRRAALTGAKLGRIAVGETPCQRAAKLFHTRLEAEEPVIIPGDRFFFTRSREGKYIEVQEGRGIENLTADWELLLTQGVSGRLDAVRRKLAEPEISGESVDFLTAAASMLEDVAAFAGRYAEAAEKSGDAEGAALLRKVPLQPAQTLYEALQSLFFLFSMFHLSGVTLQGLGRMDQYLEPFYTNGLRRGEFNREEAAELFAEFFMMLNRDCDLYSMVQQGDDGESLMLGGCRRDGSDGVNDLTLLLLEVAYDVSMINPKINLRIDSHTPVEILKAGVRLTRRGLGFPQYSNDEVVIPALVKFGYPLEEARDYTVAACWEFVIKDGRDIPNFCLVNLALAADRAIRTALRKNLSFEELLAELKPAIRAQLPPLPEKTVLLPNPLFSAFSGRCIERGLDLHQGGGSHYHFGTLGAGSSTAADSLAAVKKWVYEEQNIAPARLLTALEKNFQGEEELVKQLKDAPKTGDNTPESNMLLQRLFDDYADVLAEIPDNGLGGRLRPGTGSASGYVVLTQTDCPLRVHATADGRRDGEFISSSLSPAPGVRVAGVLSILQTYGQLNYTRLCNGGPITLEFAPVYFRNSEAIEKTAEFLRAFVRSGCQQLQMNVLDRELLQEAQRHPEQHRDLIVRVWGWSGYFVELDKTFQDQIIGRQAYGA
ncbi:pyruvate formate lyase family protein [uncultured Victivallis sp.]|uniref:pyruvate formate lyase family protein n=1 Tax=uncultured Victivallis sp. TaxID=354118 RepID=UPI0025939161|nr:pyruvate formate lyase family protein [uncultured Victivallis sp.]